MKVQEAADKLGMSPQAVRVQMRRGILPIGVCLFNECKWTYRVVDEWLYAYLRGTPIEIPEKLTEKEVRNEKEEEHERRRSDIRSYVGRSSSSNGWLRK